MNLDLGSGWVCEGYAECACKDRPGGLRETIPGLNGPDAGIGLGFCLLEGIKLTGGTGVSPIWSKFFSSDTHG